MSHDVILSSLLRDKQERLQELCMSGYIRKYCTNYELPKEVQQLCLSMYLIVVDEWDTELHNDDILFDSNTAYLPGWTGWCRERGWCHAFGSLHVIRDQLQTWKLQSLVIETESYTHQSEHKIDKKSNEIMIGIIDIDKILANLGNDLPFCFAHLPANGYAIYGTSGYKYHGKEIGKYAKQFNRQDIVTMTLDMTGNINGKYGVLAYKINDTDYGTAFDQINIDKTYCMAVCMYFANDEITILR